ncbi:type II toxin-antitoxin system RelE/ParE family toxin [Candidatus Thiosymbion oneisti]|uniref:type II toxin-antitoxin system RelE/ParE family toxin n=1 Tax=Candidatus Thiosymbion oneisti TaxID=589554 RepID=UPI003C79BF38
MAESAEQDLVDIWCFIAQDDRRAASKLIRQIEARFSTLLSHPEIGPRRDHLAKGLRAHFHRDYVLYYRFTATEVIIVRVVHGARDVQALMFDEE